MREKQTMGGYSVDISTTRQTCLSYHQTSVIGVSDCIIMYVYMVMHVNMVCVHGNTCMCVKHASSTCVPLCL